MSKVQQTSFHVYYKARQLENLSDNDRLVLVFDSSDLKIYPFQIAASAFVLRSPYLKGMILCDEAGLGKSHEAMLVIAQRWLEGQNRILLLIPNADLIAQWTELIEKYYSIPYVVCSKKEEWEGLMTEDNQNPFDQEAVIMSTYDFVSSQEETAARISWDVIVFEEANVLSTGYQEENKQAKALDRIAGTAFRLLLTATPIEKNIMDLYGLIWFIDKSVLPKPEMFLHRYLRKPENYPELAERVSKFCFRTLRSHAKQYAKIPERILITDEYQISEQEQELYDALEKYINQPEKKAFPQMNQYDLALRLFSLQSSSTSAILQTIEGVIKRLEHMADAKEELAQWQNMKQLAEAVKQDSKEKELLLALKKGFAVLKKYGANQKVVIFTESVATLKQLYKSLSQQYVTYTYYGGSDYTALENFKCDGEILISTDNGAKGFDFSKTSFVIHYDLLYNTLKMEQRIDRCHRLGQDNDVISLAFINRNNMADVRKLELVYKRMKVADGVFGVTDTVLGGFTNQLEEAYDTLPLRTQKQIEADHQTVLTKLEENNRKQVAAAEDILFTTFTRELASKVHLTPQYVSKKSSELQRKLWDVVKWFFERYNEENTDCYFEIDEEKKTITATNYEKLPILFYYWTSSRNKPYRSLKSYGMGKIFKPKQGQITLFSPLVRGILHEIACGDTGNLQIEGEDCTIGLYTVDIYAGNKLVSCVPVLCGQRKDGSILSQADCQKILQKPILSVTEKDAKAHWLKTKVSPQPLDELVPEQQLLDEQRRKITPAQQEELNRMKLIVAGKKNALQKELQALEAEEKAVQQQLSQTTGNRLKRIQLEKQVANIHKEWMKRQENLFFAQMQPNMELEEKIKQFEEQEKLTAKVQREFIVELGIFRNVGKNY